MRVARTPWRTPTIQPHLKCEEVFKLGAADAELHCEPSSLRLLFIATVMVSTLRRFANAGADGYRFFAVENASRRLRLFRFDQTSRGVVERLPGVVTKIRHVTAAQHRELHARGVTIGR